ncbi:hypothetical protein [Vibrio sp. 11-4(1)]|uniref:hypothetical protein n=1 Tax=Vibrio sp. 11-4(1) TaxID=2591018 RepID=UPI00148303D1|nr:hypothetical protein [Vibrio sp. 11-4(1)]NNN82142.1 hypothetical protein [Vibrio sp. 11-4(1)]
MGTLIRLIGTTFNNPDLPLAQIPYGGITKGLLGAYHLRHSLGLCKDLSGNGNNPVLRGSISFEENHLITGNGKNGLTTPIKHNQAQEFTICSIMRRPTQQSTSYGFGVNTYSDGANNNGGANLMGNASTGAVRHQLHVVDPVQPDNVRTVVTDFPTTEPDEWFAYIMTVSAVNGEVKGYCFKKSSSPYVTDITTAVVHGRDVDDYMIGYSNSSSNAVMHNAYAAIFDRALTEEEVATQYASMKRYASAVGLGDV